MAWSKVSRHARGYGSRWEKVRKLALERDRYLCQEHLRKGRVEPATEVDHIISKVKWVELHHTDAGDDDLTNLQSLCHACHVEKTAAEKGYSTRKRIGPDGYPVDE